MEKSSKEMLSCLRGVKGYSDFYQLIKHNSKKIYIYIYAI